MRTRYRVLMILALAAAMAAAGCGKRGGNQPSARTGGSTAGGNAEIKPMTPVAPGKEPISEGKTPFETALMRAKWRMESAQTAISRGDSAGVQGAVEGARVALADARRSAPRGTGRQVHKTLAAIARDLDTVASPGEAGGRKAADAAQDAVKKLAQLLEG
jgi:hypothetical protein